LLAIYPANAAMLASAAAAERGYEIACRLSVTFRYRDQLGWNSSKIIPRPNLRSLTPNMSDLVKREHPKITVE